RGHLTGCATAQTPCADQRSTRQTEDGAGAGCYNIGQPLVVSIDTQRGDGPWKRESVHELTVHWQLMKGEGDDRELHGELAKETVMESGAAMARIDGEATLQFAAQKWNVVKVSAQLRPEPGASWSDDQFAAYLTIRDNDHRKQKMAETKGFDSAGALTSTMMTEAMNAAGLDGGPRAAQGDFNALEDIEDKERLLPVEAIWGPEVGDP